MIGNLGIPSDNDCKLKKIMDIAVASPILRFRVYWCQNATSNRQLADAASTDQGNF